MAEDSRVDTLYGQFGEPVYDGETNEWRFSRSCGRFIGWKALGDPKIVIESTAIEDSTASAADGEEAPSVRREKQLKSLVQNNPELQPASPFLGHLVRVSEAVERGAAIHDPAKGNLLAVGTTRDEALRRSASIAVLPSGPTGSDVRFVQIQKQKRGWEDTHKTWLAVPTIYGEESTWRGPGAPVQSVVFAYPLEQGDSYVAVRLLTKIVIFRPVLRHAVLPSGTRLDQNLVLDLPIQDFGGIMCVDIAFNTWDTCQFALACRSGAWSVWTLPGRKIPRAKQICCGSLSNDSANSRSHATEDGWGRISWVCDQITVAVCNRHRVALFDVSGETSADLQSVEVFNSNGTGWILDMVIIPSRPRFFCVLTSTSVMLFCVDRTVREDLRVKNVMNLRHFRNPEDISLRLHIFEDGNDAIIYIRSEMTSPILHYRATFSDSGSITGIGDPAEMHVPVSGSSGVRIAMYDMHIAPVFIETKQQAETSQSLGNRYQELDVQFYSVTSLLKDFSVRQTLCFAAATGSQRRHIEPISWEQALTKSATKLSNDDFIVDDDEFEELEQMGQKRSVSAYVLRRREQATANLRDTWTVNYEHTVRQLNHVDVSEVIDFDQVLEEARGVMQSANVQQSAPMRTLWDLSDGEIALRGIEEASTKLEELRLLQATQTNAREDVEDFENVETDRQLEVHLVSVPPILDISALGLSALHQALVHDVTAASPQDTHELVQLAKEHLMLRMAAAVALAGHVIRLDKPEDERVPDSQVQGQSQSQIQIWELPVRSLAAASQRTTPSAYYDASSQPQSPAPSGAPSAITGSSHPSSFAGPHMTRLSHYTTFTTNSSQIFFPRRIVKVLGHWKLGTDPSDYDWLATSRQFSRWDDEAEGEEMTEKERLRMQRRTERYVRRQRREAEESQRQQMLSSQAPEIVSASQPQGRPTTARAESQQAASQAIPGSSQTLGPSQVPMASQVLPGRHGGRPPPKKKRKSGF